MTPEKLEERFNKTFLHPDALTTSGRWVSGEDLEYIPELLALWKAVEQVRTVLGPEEDWIYGPLHVIDAALTALEEKK